MIAKLKLYLIAFGAALLAALGLYGAGRKSGKDAERIKTVEKSRETERKATKAVLDGQKRQKEAQRAPVDARARRDFES